MTTNHVAFFDTTLRDGEQSPGCSMTTQEKLTMAHALEDLGVDIIEAGFAMASEGDFAAIATITQAVRKPRIASLARATTEDIEMAAKSPSEAIANPASIMSTPRSSSAWAMVSFSCVVMLQPGDCSPSRSVVSKKTTWFDTFAFMDAPAVGKPLRTVSFSRILPP